MDQGAMLEMGRKVAAEWFPAAAEEYAQKNWDRFADPGTRAVSWNNETFFERLMPLFWENDPTVSLVPDDQREAFEAAVYAAVAPKVWAAVRDIIEDAAIESYLFGLDTGMRQRDFL